MDELVQWLGEQLDEDERIARAAAEPEKWIELNRAPHLNWSVEYWADPDRAAVVAEESSAYPVVVTAEGIDEADAEARTVHVAEHDPARVLREVDADRKLLALFVEVGAREVDLDDASEYADGWVNALGMAVRLRALPFSNRPGYRKEWRP